MGRFILVIECAEIMAAFHIREKKKKKKKKKKNALMQLILYAQARIAQYRYKLRAGIQCAC